MNFSVAFMMAAVMTITQLGLNAGAAEISNPSMARSIVDNTGSFAQLDLQLRTEKVSSDAIRAIETDIKKSGATKWPAFTLRKNEIWLNGKPTGLKISSYSPFNVTYHGRTWVFERSKSADENYFALVKMLSLNPTALIWDYLAPRAYANDRGHLYGSVAFMDLSGATIGYAAGIMVSLGFALICPYCAIVGAIIGSIAGSVTGALVGLDDNREAAAKDQKQVQEILAKGKWSCEPNLVTIRMPAHGDVSRIVIDGAKKTGRQIAVYDSRNIPLDREHFAPNQNAQLVSLLGTCRNSSDAAKWQMYSRQTAANLPSYNAKSSMRHSQSAK